MCGISGFISVGGDVGPEPLACLERMNKVLGHRGPDDQGVWCDESRRVFLGHTRLSIIDLSSAGHQPMLSDAGSCIVYNGEIYNFAALKRSFPNQKFFSETDTEVLLYLLERHGPDFLGQLNGMFSLAIWDPSAQCLHLARDRIGIKPLYYTVSEGIFAFASEIKALLTLPWVKRELDEEALYHFLTFSKVMPPRTMFKGIYKLRPGHRLEVDSSGIRHQERFWEVSYSELSDLSEAEAKTELLKQLDRSVQYRMVSDVPVGAFLSGGVDSSAVVALMSRYTEKQTATYSIGFEDAPGFDELEHAGRIAKMFGTQHFERVVKPREIRDFVHSMAEIYDEPLADATSIPIHFISELARQNGTIVVLTGDGSDELLCGYRHWMRYSTLYPYFRLYSRMPRGIKQLVASSFGFVSESSPVFEILNRATNGQEFFWGGARGIKESVKGDFLSAEFMNRMSSVDSHEEILYYRREYDRVRGISNGRDDIGWMCYLGIKSIVPDYFMYRADKLGMANSIEIRVPFLDHNLVNFGLSIPSKYKIAEGEPKYILKSALAQLLPHDVLYRRKQGFCVPLQEWAGDIMIDYLDENLHSFCSDTGLFREDGLRNQISAAKSGNPNYTSALWNLYFLMSWFRTWLL